MGAKVHVREGKNPDQEVLYTAKSSSVYTRPTVTAYLFNSQLEGRVDRAGVPLTRLDVVTLGCPLQVVQLNSTTVVNKICNHSRHKERSTERERERERERESERERERETARVRDIEREIQIERLREGDDDMHPIFTPGNKNIVHFRESRWGKQPSQASTSSFFVDEGGDLNPP